MRTSAERETAVPGAGSQAKPALIGVEEAKHLDVDRVNELFMGHLNPGQLHFMKLLGFHKVIIDRAEGIYYIDREGRKILDFFGGFGSLAFGHNHPRIIAARQKFQAEGTRSLSRSCRNMRPH